MGLSIKRFATIAVGYGLAKIATSLAYITAMGSVASSIGFVSELDFMFAMTLASAVTAAGVVVGVRSGRLASWQLSQIPAVLALGFGFLLGATQVLAGFPPVLSALVLGALCGFSTTILCAVWLEVFVAQADAASAAYQIIAALAIQGVVVSIVSSMPAMVAVLVSIASLAGSSVVLSWVRTAIAPPEEERTLERHRGSRFPLLQCYVCMFVLVGVIGILHTSVLGSSSEHIVGDVRMWMPLAVATGITVVLALATMKRPNPMGIYKACFPCMLVILSLLPFAGELLGSLVGLITITCYDVCGMMFLLFIVERSRALGYSSYMLSALYMGGSGLFLFIGLSVGLLLGVLSADYGFSLLTLLAFAAIYPLVIGLVLLARRAKLPSKSDGTAGGAVERQQPAFSGKRLEDIASGADLTKREREIFGFLVRGRSAKHIAETLYISENTAWAHIKRVYAKTGVHSKQELMDLVEGDGDIR